MVITSLQLDAYMEVKPGKRRLEPITKVTPELVAGLKSLWLAGLEAGAVRSNAPTS
jgi:hypothetical protein